MIVTILKWTVPPLLVLLTAAAIFTKKTFHVEVFIPAPPEDVWAVLMNTEAYPDWNPVFVAVDGAYTEGEKVTSSVRFPDGSITEMTATVKTLAEGRELRQYLGIPGILTADHQWILEPVEGGTRVTQHEIDRGIYLWFWNSDWVEPAYQKVSDALATRAGEVDTNL